jgi:hypothetical protein
MENPIHRVSLYLVYQPRIQASLDRCRDAWNLHQMTTEHHRSPWGMYQLSKAKAIREGYWHSDPGDDIPTARDPHYGDDDGPLPPEEELASDPLFEDHSAYRDMAEEYVAGVFVTADEEIAYGASLMSETDLHRDDGNDGIDVFCEVVLLMASKWVHYNSN